MDRQEIEEIIIKVFSEYKETWGSRELPLDFPVEVSAKHVHLTEKAVEQLFGPGAKLTPKRPLSQPGQFLSEERVTLVTEKGRIENVAVLGPVRPEIQTELSQTDCRILGIQAPLRMSGDLKGAADVYIIGPKGIIDAKESAIIAQAHVHLTPSDAEKAGVTNGQVVSVTLPGERSVTLENVICRVSSQAGLAMHIDFDEANSCMLPKNATARMKAEGIKKAAADCSMTGKRDLDSSRRKETAASDRGFKADRAGRQSFEGKLITESVAKQIAAGGKAPLSLLKGVIITPSAKDVLHHAGIEIIWQAGR